MDISIIEYSLDILINYNEYLSSDGQMAFIFPSNIFKNQNNLNLFINAVIDLPSGVFAPYSSMESKILIFSRNRFEKRFIAELDSRDDVENILDNLIGEKKSKNPKYGIMVDLSEFIDMKSFMDNKEMERIYKKFIGKSFTIVVIVKL